LDSTPLLMGFHFFEYFLKLGIERSLILQENSKSKTNYSFKNKNWATPITT
jgi:hypothetical protein